jgi:hypothetical protein
VKDEIGSDVEIIEATSVLEKYVSKSASGTTPNAGTDIKNEEDSDIEIVAYMASRKKVKRNMTA